MIQQDVTIKYSL